MSGWTVAALFVLLLALMAPYGTYEVLKLIGKSLRGIYRWFKKPAKTKRK